MHDDERDNSRKGMPPRPGEPYAGADADADADADAADGEDPDHSRWARSSSPWRVRRISRLRKRRRRRIQAVAILPSLFTLGNLIAGFAAIHYASKPGDATVAGPLDWTPLTMAAALIFLGMFCDAVDGSIARLTRTTTDIGAQLDSLADIVTFGVAPAYLTLRLVSMYYLSEGATPAVLSPDHDNLFGRIFWVIAAIYVSCSALRLARFNVETGSSESLDDHLLFRGLPSPGAAGCLASLILFHQDRLVWLEAEWFSRTTGLGMAGIMLLCAFAMVSRLPYIHVANKYVRGHASFAYIVMMATILAFAVFFPQEALAIGFTTYAVSAPARSVWLIYKRRTRRLQEAAAKVKHAREVKSEWKKDEKRALKTQPKDRAPRDHAQCAPPSGRKRLRGKS